MKSFTTKGLLLSLLAGWLGLTPSAKAQNGLLREVYLNSGGSLNAFTNNANYPNNPSVVSSLLDFEVPENFASNYGQRVRGYIVPPLTGDYVFWIAADNEAILLLSNDENPATRREIARVTSATNPKEWTRQLSQQSNPIRLEAGRRYYIEALMADPAGADHMAVRWQIPDAAQTIEEPIPSTRLLAELVGPLIAAEPIDVTVVEGLPASFTVRSGNVGTINFQWQRIQGGATNIIAGATNATFTLDKTTIPDSDARFQVVLTNLFGTNASRAARLTVTPDITAPEVVNVLNQGERNHVTVLFSKPVSKTSAENVTNYTIVPTIEVRRAQLQDDLRTVILDTSDLTFGTTYSMSIANIEDLAFTPNFMEPHTLPFVFGYSALDASFIRGIRESLGPSTRRTGLIISEIMYNPAVRSDGRNLEFVEIYNTQPFLENIGGFRLSGAIEYTFPPGTFINAGSFLVVAAAPDDLRNVYGLDRVLGGYTNRLQNSAGAIRLVNHLGAVLLEANYGSNPPWPASADGAGHSLVLARPSLGERDPKAWSASEVMGGSPGRDEAAISNPFRSIVINEFLANTDDPQQPDFIELYNYSNQEVDISGLILTDDLATNRFRLPSGTRIPGLGYVTFTQTNFGFALNARGETIFLFNSGRTRVIDAVRFAEQANGRSTGRFPDGASRFRVLEQPTPAHENARPWLPPVVINEIMYHPISENDDEEYIELYNRSTNEIDLAGWRFSDGIDFTFPANTRIAPGAYLVVAKNVALLKQKHANANTASFIGDYIGNLSNGGERVALTRPVFTTITNQTGQSQSTRLDVLVDEVVFFDGGRWGVWSDAGGSSLELINPNSDNDFASNWADSDESSKSTNLWTAISHTGVLDHGHTNYIPDDLHVILLGKGEALLDQVAVLNFTNKNVMSNPDFETGLKDWVFQGNHAGSTLEAGVNWPDGPGSNSLHIRAAARGDTAANRIRTRLTTALPIGSTNTISAQARWLRGSPEILLRLHGNWLEAVGRLRVPENLGTPGQANSRFLTNAGPSIMDVSHSPALPPANQAVTVTARIHDTERLGAITLNYRVDPSTNFTSVGMLYKGAGIYSGIIPGQLTSNQVAFYIQATDTSGAKALFPADAPRREALVFFGDTQVPGTIGSYHIWVSQTNIARWTQRERGSNEELDATFVYNNQRVIYNMGVDYSGSPFHWTGYNGPLGNRANYVMVFPPDDLLLGETDFVLNLPANLGNDTTAIREQLFYWLVRETGHPYSHRRYHHLFLNGQRRSRAPDDFGTTRDFIFEDVQQPNRDFIQEWYPNDADGELFKIEDWFEFNDSATSFNNVNATLQNFVTTGGQKKIARYRWNWRPRATEATANDFVSLMKLVDAVNTMDPDAYTRAVESLIDVEEWMKAFATRHVVGDWDSYGYRRGKNMYAYKPENGKWQLLHWDVAFAFGRGDGAFQDLFDFSVDPTMARMLSHPPFRRVYLRILSEIANGPLLASRIDLQIDNMYKGLLANGVTTVSSPEAIKTWASQRRGFILTQLGEGAAAFAITSNSGNNFSTNRNQITLSGTAPMEVAAVRVNGVVYPVTWTGVTSWTLRYALPQRSANLLTVVGLDRNGNPIAGASDTISVTYTGAAEFPQNRVVINEVMYQPSIEGAQFVELHNTSPTFTFDLSNLELNGLDFVFPGGALISPGGYLVIAQDADAFASAYGASTPVFAEFNGSLDRDGETLTLLRRDASGTNLVIDSVTYDDAPPWPASTDGAASLQLLDATADSTRVASWGAASPTPGAGNAGRMTLSPYPPLFLSEVFPNGNDPWVELYNASMNNINLGEYFLTDNYTNLAQWAFPSSAVIKPGEYLVVSLAGGGTGSELKTNFRISSGTGSIALAGTNTSRLVVLDYLNYNQLLSDRSYGAYPAGQNQHRRDFFKVTRAAANDPAPAPIRLYINEWMAANADVLADPADNDFDDWFEIYNPGTTAVNLSGFNLTDVLTNKTKFTIPNGVTIPAGGYLLVWADEESGQTSSNQLHVNFKLDQGGEALGLYAPDGQTVDEVTFGAQTNNVSQGRSSDGAAAPFVYFTTPTPGAANRSEVPSGIRFTTVTVSGGQINLVWTAQEGAIYQVEYKENLSDATWTLLRPVQAAGATASTTDTVGANSRRFYRIRQ